jgi:hypothetical protein
METHDRSLLIDLVALIGKSVREPSTLNPQPSTLNPIGISDTANPPWLNCGMHDLCVKGALVKVLMIRGTLRATVDANTIAL